jgi:hypothetical protein
VYEYINERISPAAQAVSGAIGKAS